MSVNIPFLSSFQNAMLTYIQYTVRKRKRKRNKIY